MSPEHPEDDDFLEDEEQEEYGQRSIFATGWFRAVLVLLVLAVIAVIAVPLIGGWFEPTPPPKVVTTKPSEPAPAPLPSTPAPPSKVETPAPAPPPAAQMPSQTPTPTPAPPPATPAPVTPPVVSAPPARPETPAPSTPGKAAEKPRAAKPAAAGSYWVQVGAFKESKNAEGLARKLRSEGFTVQVAKVTRDEPLHVVRVGGYPDRSKATTAREELQGKGHSGFVTHGPAK
ncbi:MAG TPA: SPOR domain-containing protein [Methylomirabilota bacterium]|nr:SPOR domain-containing protein [Methylomirabilota bacterium]